MQKQDRNPISVLFVVNNIVSFSHLHGEAIDLILVKYINRGKAFLFDKLARR